MQKLQKEISLSFLSHPYLSGGTTVNYSYLECASTSGPQSQKHFTHIQSHMEKPFWQFVLTKVGLYYMLLSMAKLSSLT